MWCSTGHHGAAAAPRRPLAVEGERSKPTHAQSICRQAPDPIQVQPSSLKQRTATTTAAPSALPREREAQAGRWRWLRRRGHNQKGGMLDGEADEVLDEVDDNNQLTGRTVPRKLAHAQARSPSPAPPPRQTLSIRNPERRWGQEEGWAQGGAGCCVAHGGGKRCQKEG